VTVNVPIPDKAPGDIFTESMWDLYLRDNINKLLDRGHRTLTVAQFAALTGLEDGDEAYVEVDSANGLLWHLVFEASEATYKWRFLGGPPLWSEVTAAESTASTTYVGLTTAGPTVALPKSGDYDVQHGYRATTNTGDMRHSYDIGATAAVDADACFSQTEESSLIRRRRKTGLGAVSLTSKYRVTSGTQAFADRFMAVTPVRIRHDA